MIIKSLLDTDLYKLTMQQAVIALFPSEIVRYELIIRVPRDFPPGFEEALKAEIDALSTLQIQLDEIEFLKKTCYFLKLPYIDFLRGYRFDPNEVRLSQNGQTLSLSVEGYWYKTILWEVPLMALISELFFRLTNQEPLPETERAGRIARKVQRLETIGAHFSDFGTRRRFSFENHDLVVATCARLAPTVFAGTSNPYLAMKHHCKAMGTQAHEWYMSIAALYGYTKANNIGMEKWVEVYEGDLGIALTDTFTSDIFFSDFNSKFAKLFDGIRQDSGDPIKFAEKAIQHYKKLRIDPASKAIVFSDSLDIARVEKIHDFCKGKINDSYGIGTHLTNDVGVQPLNMVIKLTAIRIKGSWVSTVKLSDDPGKHTGAIEAVTLCKQTLRIPE
jgi:nicotinate phosphoribosyltransferase